MAENTIKLSWNLTNIVWKELEKKGIKTRTNSYGLLTNAFTQEELEQITHLNLENVSGSFEGLSNLTNLKSLRISSSKWNAYTSAKDLISITDKDIFEIEKLTNLQHLTINNQRLITSIDISNFTNLQSLELTKNEELVNIVGLDKNKTIGSLTIYDSNNLASIKNLDKFIEQNPNLFEINLDVLLFPEVIGYKQNGSFNQNALDRIKDLDSSCTWSETCGGNLIKINNYQIAQIHKKALAIVRNYCKSSSTAENVAVIDRWLAENVKYNYGALHSNLRGEVKDGILSGPIRGANGTYNAFMYNSCVCEGYTRAMQYMLKLKGIKTANVDCIAGKDNLHLADRDNDNEFIVFNYNGKSEFHSICRIDTDSGCYYCDPCWDAGHFQCGDKSLPYLLLTKEQISSDHTLSFNEKNISDKSPLPEDYVNHIKNIANNKITNNIK